MPASQLVLTIGSGLAVYGSVVLFQYFWLRDKPEPRKALNAERSAR